MRLRWAGYEVAAFLKNPMVIIIEIMCSTKRDGVLFFVQRRASWSCLVWYCVLCIVQFFTPYFCYVAGCRARAGGKGERGKEMTTKKKKEKL
jgi:hypothetical protein